MSSTPATSDLLGEIVTWDTKTSEIGLQAIRDALKASGLPDVANDLNNRSAFMRATAALKENRSIDKVNQTKDGKVVFQLTKKENKGDTIDFNYECQVTLDLVTGDIHSDSMVVESEARSLFAHAMNVRTASDVTRMVQRLFKDNADLFPINPTKGVAYFCPAQHSEFTGKVEAFLRTVGGNVWRFPVPKGTAHGNKSVQEAVSAGLRSVLDELNQCVTEWDDTTRKDTMSRGIEKWKVLKYKAEVYADFLQTEQATLLKEIESAKAALINKVSSIRPEEAAA